MTSAFHLVPIAGTDPAAMRGILIDPRTRKHMPLAEDGYSIEWVQSWLQAKAALWTQADAGPWAV